MAFEDERAGIIAFCKGYILVVEGQSGHLSIPKGGREPCDATLRDTAFREAGEETGIDFRGMPMRKCRLPTIYTYWVVELPERITPRVPASSKGEIRNCFWHPSTSLKGKFNKDLHQVILSCRAWRARTML